MKAERKDLMKAEIRKYWFLVLYLLLALAVLCIHPLTGDEIVSFPWKTAAYIFMLLLLEEGLKREKIALPLFRVLNSVRSTPFMFFLLLLSTFVLSLFFFSFMVVAVMVPFAIKLLEASEKKKYTAVTTALITLLSVITTLFTPFSEADLYLFLESGVSYTVYMKELLPPFFASLTVFAAETFIVLGKTKGDEIYLHIENEDYWERERRGIRILYTAFFLVVLFGRRFNTIDLLLVVALAFLFLDRKIYKEINWGAMATLLLLMLSGYTLGKTSLVENKVLTGLIPVVFTRLGGLTSGIRTPATLPAAVISFSLPLLYAVREPGTEKKETVKNYALLALPHAILFILFSLFF